MTDSRSMDGPKEEPLPGTSVTFATYMLPIRTTSLSLSFAVFRHPCVSQETSTTTALPSLDFPLTLSVTQAGNERKCSAKEETRQRLGPFIRLQAFIFSALSFNFPSFSCPKEPLTQFDILKFFGRTRRRLLSLPPNPLRSYVGL